MKSSRALAEIALAAPNLQQPSLFIASVPNDLVKVVSSRRPLHLRDLCVPFWSVLSEKVIRAVDGSQFAFARLRVKHQQVAAVTSDDTVALQGERIVKTIAIADWTGKCQVPFFICSQVQHLRGNSTEFNHRFSWFSEASVSKMEVQVQRRTKHTTGSISK